jgi:hypothetical protein
VNSKGKQQDSAAEKFRGAKSGAQIINGWEAAGAGSAELGRCELNA